MQRRMWWKANVVGGLALVAAFGMSGCVILEGFEALPDTSVALSTPTSSPATAEGLGASHALAALRTVERRTSTAAGYQRSAFGSAWSDVDGNGCNQRDDVLQRDAVPGSLVVGVQGRCGHDVLAGVWIDPYTAVRIELSDLKDRRQAQAVQIDHVVPLAEAWVSGADGWSAQRRRHFANDLGVLLAVDGPTNASKGSGDPAAWRPRKGFQCAYAQRWITVKTQWDLGVDPSERAALAAMLQRC